LRILFTSLSSLRFTVPSIDVLFEDLDPEHASATDEYVAGAAAVTPLPFKDRITLRDVRFAYPNTENPIFDRLNLDLHANTTIGIVGSTGSGKTTLIDILLGLLAPDDAKPAVDGVPVTSDNVRAWQRNLGYVPQHIF